jgi:hypothetical protein
LRYCCFPVALLVLYWCFTGALLVLYWCVGTLKAGSGKVPKQIKLVADCFTGALLVLYWCFTAALAP